jgi:hypothetical protein
MRSILLVVDESTKARLGKKLDTLEDKVFVVVAKDPVQTMTTIKDYIALMDVIEKLIEHGVILEDGRDFELAYSIARDLGRVSGPLTTKIMTVLRDMKLGLDNDELARAVIFIKGFLGDD